MSGAVTAARGSGDATVAVAAAERGSGAARDATVTPVRAHALQRVACAPLTRCIPAQNTFTNNWAQSMGGNEPCSPDGSVCISDDKCCSGFCDKSLPGDEERGVGWCKEVKKPPPPPRCVW